MRLPAGAQWPGFLATLDERGYTVLPGLLEPRACGELAALYSFVFLYLSAAGGGPWSVDEWWRRRQGVNRPDPVLNT